ncbi:MAG TPA: PKD domain-containing protein [Solirubrobacteraceae bacterium]|nr:PKD domain-containing protein [Solirubrobacteraceae bacterium]
MSFPVRRRSLPLLLAVLALATGLVSLAGAAARPGEARAASAAARMVAIARGELRKGVREIPDGSNKGGRIRMYGGSTSPRFYPAPWCAYFVSWVARKAGRPLGPAGAGFGYVPYLRSWAAKTGRWKKTPRSGDLIVFPQHVGLVEQVYKNGTLTTIEGNSSNRVARRWRRWGEAQGYARVATGGKVTSTKPSGGSEKPSTPTRNGGQKPIARISVYPGTAVQVGEPAGFSANDSSGDLTKYAWDLDGDGAYDDGASDNAERAYAKPGAVRIGLRVRDRKGRTSYAHQTLTVTAGDAAPTQPVVTPKAAGRPPVAKGNGPSRVAVNAVATFDAGRSSSPDGAALSYAWDFDGNGTYEAAGRSATTRFTAPGGRDVRLAVTDAWGQRAETTVRVEVTNDAPNAVVGLPAQVVLDEPTTLDASGSVDPDSRVASYEWDLDDDGLFETAGAQPTWTFTSAGWVKVRLRVTDDFGAAKVTTASLRVLQRPRAQLALVWSTPLAGASLAFSANGTLDPDGRVERLEWDLDGDGHPDQTTYSPGVKVWWTYPTSGDHTATLTVTDNDGLRSVATLPVPVR